MNTAFVAIQRQWPFLLSLTVHAAVIGVGYGMLSRPAVFAMGSDPGPGIVVDIVSELPNMPQQDSGAALFIHQKVQQQSADKPQPEPVLPDDPEPEIALEKPKKVVKVDKQKPRPVPEKKSAPEVESSQAQPTTGSGPASDSDARASLGATPILSANAGGSGGAGLPGAEPDYLRNPPPPYPREARRAGEEGTVLLSAHVNASGEVEDVVVKRSSSFGRLDQAALKAVRRWRFKPKQIAGISVASQVDVPITFVLRG